RPDMARITSSSSDWPGRVTSARRYPGAPACSSLGVSGQWAQPPANTQRDADRAASAHVIDLKRIISGTHGVGRREVRRGQLRKSSRRIDSKLWLPKGGS